MNKEKTLRLTIVIMKIIGITGLFAMAAVAPNALQAMRIFGLGRRPYYKSDVESAFGRMIKDGSIEIKNKNNKKFVRLTERGRAKLLKYQMGETKIKKPKKWDKKWRVIIFDIKEYKRYLRDSLRGELINLGFIKLQNSVWVYPYECEEISIMLKSYLKLGQEAMYMKVEKIENDRWLKKKFKLK